MDKQRQPTLTARRPTQRTEEHIAEQVKRLRRQARLNVVMDREELFAIKRFAVQHETTMSDLVREALKEYFQKRNSRAPSRTE
jgi:predicted GIY-YIG superfamily endonuclease